MVSPQANGFIFEKYIHHFLCKSRQRVYTEKDIKSKYHISGLV